MADLLIFLGIGLCLLGLSYRIQRIEIEMRLTREEMQKQRQQQRMNNNTARALLGQRLAKQTREWDGDDVQD